VGLIFFGVTLAVFWSACQNGFLSWDDNAYVYQEPHVFSGLSFKNLSWAMTANVVGNWHPLTLLSLQLDAQLFGRGPMEFHRTAVVLHAINALLAFHALRLLTGSPLRSGIVALLFALHPLRVESVAWISERKDLLSGFFFFLTLIAYARYCQCRSVGRYLIVATFLALGLCSKPMLVTTPCLLLLLDYWPLKRITTFSIEELPRIWGLVLEKLPLFGLSGVVAVVTMIYQKKAMSDLEKLPLDLRLENAARACAAYLRQTFWPSHLSPLYPIPESSVVGFSAAITLLLVVTVLVVWQSTRRPYLIVGWLWFLGMLVPVSGLIQVGVQQRADRYTYLPHVGLFVALTWGIASLVKLSRREIFITGVCTIAAVVGLSRVTVEQIPVWRSDKSMWSQAYAADHRNRAAICYLIPYIFLEGHREKALQLANEAIMIQDRYHREGLVTLGNILAANGEFEASIRALDQAIQVRPDAVLFASRAGSHAALDEWDKAIEDFRRAIELSPNNMTFHFCLAHALAQNGQSDEAQEVRATAIRLSPRWADSAAVMAWEATTKGEADQQFLFLAVCLAEEANVMTGGNQSHFLDVLAATYAARKQFGKAVSTATLAMQRAEIERQPEYAKMIWSRLELYRNQKQYRR
jgi:cytochrome c-type biogenesis protein CcmH/NrfG